MPKQLLGGLSVSAFLRRHWQKQPLLVRQAIPDFDGVLDFGALVELTSREDSESRLIMRDGNRWTVEHGPFPRKRFSRLPARNWTLLLQGLERMVPAARDLLSNFNFIPHSRLDDVMVSYAPPGGGVGPHFDSYDVFLLQGPGRRRWQISHQSDLRLKEDAPLKLLRKFRPEQEWTLDPGDMLYLPPGWAHDGVAIDACMTYSIGFRAPAWHDLAVEFLRHLEDEIFADGMYEDPHLIPTRQPGRVAPDMIREATNRLERLRWRPSVVPRFLGRHLTEPKTHVVFAQPQPALSRNAFAQAAQRRGVQLDLKTQMLYTGVLFFINGESAQVTGRARDTLKELADRRRLRAVDSSQRGLATLLHEWYR